MRRKQANSNFCASYCYKILQIYDLDIFHLKIGIPDKNDLYATLVGTHFIQKLGSIAPYGVKHISVRYEGAHICIIKTIWGLRVQEFEIMNNLINGPICYDSNFHVVL